MALKTKTKREQLNNFRDDIRFTHIDGDARYIV